MAQPVWVLSVDLQTKTATFQSGMAEAARSAHTAFKDIGGGAGVMADGVGKRSLDVRHSLGLVDNVIRGAHAQAMADLIRMWAQSAIVMSTLPIAAAAAGVALIGGIAYEAAEHVKKLKEEQEKLANDFTNLDTAGATAFGDLDAKILELQKRTDELHNNHLAALNDEIGLIDHQTLNDIRHQFEELAKDADSVMTELKSKWYELGSGSDGAKHALDDFMVKWQNLKAHGKDDEANNLLSGTLASAHQTLDAINVIQATWSGNMTAQKAFGGAKALLERQNYSIATDKALQKEKASQEALLQVLNDMVGAQDRLNVANVQAKNLAKEGEEKDAGARGSARARQAADSAAAIAESQLSAQKAGMDALLTVDQAGVAAREAVELSFSNRLYAIKQQQIEGEIKALDRGNADYLNQLKSLQDKETELTASHAADVASIHARAQIDANQRELQEMEEAIREQVDATREGGAARLAAIDAGLREEEARQQQNTQYYRDLQTQRTEVARQMAEEQAKQSEAMGTEAAQAEAKQQDASLQEVRQWLALYNSMHFTSSQERLAQDKAVAQQEFLIKQQELQSEIAALDKTGKEYLQKLKQLKDEEKQLRVQSDLQIAALESNAQQQYYRQATQALQKFNSDVINSLSQVLMRHENFAQMMTRLGDQVVSGAIQNAIKMAEAAMIGKESDAAHAARKAYNIGVDYGGPAGMVLGPIFAALAFATVSGYAEGTDKVPGVGRGDVVPAMLTPGEGIVPGGVMDGLRNMVRNGSFGQGNSAPLVHTAVTYHLQALDADGMDKVLKKHGPLLEKHIQRAVRKANN